MNLSPYRKLNPPEPGSVRWTEGFWANRFDLCQDHTIPSTWRAMNDPANSAVFSNFYVAAGLVEGEQSGVDWGDGDCYKWMEAMSHVYSVTGDKEILVTLDELIAVIAQAQDDDGYICTQIQLRPERERWSRRRHHELYNMGHLFTAAAVHHRVTGQTNFLDVAVKLGEYLYSVFAPCPPELAHYGWNPSNIMGLVDLYRATQEPRFLELAGIFVDMRGTGTDPKMVVRQDHFFREDRGDQNQDHVPLRDELHAVGHAVTAMYLYCGAADVFAETGDDTLLTALERIWDDVVERKMYVTGAVGAYHQGVSIRHDDVHEAFGRPYELPNDTAYNETCANIGNAMFSWRLFNITGDPQYAEIMERVIYNSALSPVSVDGERFFYTNPLRFYGQDHTLLSNDEYERWHTYHCYCCPTQVARSTAWMVDWAYSFADDGVWVNLYSGSVVEKRLAGGEVLQLEMETDYPWDGKVGLKIGSAPQKPYSIWLRIPEWADGATVTVNGARFDGEITPDSYLELNQAWKPGDYMEIDFPMDVRLVQSHPRVAENRNHVAVMRGPVVYCLESADLPEGTVVSEIHLPEASKFESVHQPDLLGGVTTLKTTALRKSRLAAPHGLYRPHVPAIEEEITVQLIPYYAWANRGISDMSVWIPIS